MLENKQIGHSKSLKILGTVINEMLDWSTHIYNCENPLIRQLKTHLHAIKYARTFMSNEFLLKYSNAILISKLNYHVEIWGQCTKGQQNDIN